MQIASAIVVDSWLTPLAALKVLIVGDDRALGLTLAETLERSGMRTAFATNGAEGLTVMRSFEPDIVLVDRNLPYTDGIGLVSLLAGKRDCGIIVVSCWIDDADVIAGLELGADDYVCKPASPGELLARIRAVHRRIHICSAVKRGPAEWPDYQVGRTTIYLKERLAKSANGEPVKLTAAEFTVLETLLAASGQTVSRDSLSAAVLRHPWRFEDRSIDRLIFSLRQKLEAGDDQRLIYSIRGAGYMLTPNAVAIGAQPQRSQG